MFLLGGGASGAPAQIWVLFVLAAFLSVMVHELGHALAGKKFGAYPSIYLHGFGGVTTLPGAYFSRNQSMWVSFAGPLASMGGLGQLDGVSGHGIDVTDEPEFSSPS